MTVPRSVAALALAALLAACASSPPSRFFTLSGAAPPARPAAAPSVSVGPVTIPAVVDRPEIVVTVGDNEVWLDEFNRWAAPLADNIGLAVAENLAAALGTSQVTTSTPAAATPDYRVAINVQRFESAPGNFAAFDATFTVRRSPDGATAGGRTTVRESLPERGYDALAAAHSRSLARLSRDVAGAIDALKATPAAPTPSPAR
ncbi:MAG: PqiC family protein [Burkholderiales bacterium]